MTFSPYLVYDKSECSESVSQLYAIKDVTGTHCQLIKLAIPGIHPFDLSQVRYHDIH